MRVRKFKRGEDYRIMWKSIKGERRIVLDCPPDILVEVLNASIPFDLTGQYNVSKTFVYLVNKNCLTVLYLFLKEFIFNKFGDSQQ